MVQATPQPILSSVDASDSLATPSGIQLIDKSVGKPSKSPVTLEEFLDWYPDGYGRYELYDGVIVEMQPTGTHEQVASFLSLKFGIEADRLGCPWMIARQALVKPLDEEKQSGYVPDVVVINQPGLETEPMWKKRSLLTKGETIKIS